MKKPWIAAVIAGVVLSAAVCHAEMPPLRGTAMLSCSGMPCVDLTVKNGKHLKLLIDLGNSSSVLDSAAAEQAGLTVTPQNGTDQQGQPSSGDGSATLEGASLGGVSLGYVPVRVRSLAPSIEKGSLPQADGVLGYAAFHDRILQLDYKKQMVKISEPLTTAVACPGFCGDLSTPAFGKQGSKVLVTTGFSVNGKPVTAQLDTLYTGTMLIYPESVDKLDLRQTSGVNQTEIFPYTDGGIPMRESRAKVESFGRKALAHNTALFFATPQVHVPDGQFDGTVGAGLLVGHVVTIDFHSQHFWLA